jgi:phospholipid transport system substrate-binding protein
MNGLRHGLVKSAAALAAALAAVLTPAAADEAAERFVARILDEANEVFAAPTLAARNAGIERLVDRYVDMQRVARFALGPYVRQASEAQLEEYYPLFRRYATTVYQGMLDEYTGERLEVTGSVDRSERDIIVNSRIVDAKPGSEYEDLVVHWRVYRPADGGETIVDAGAAGVWLAIEQQSTFKSIIANNGGGSAGIDALIADLKKKTAP